MTYVFEAARIKITDLCHKALAADECELRHPETDFYVESKDGLLFVLAYVEFEGGGDRVSGSDFDSTVPAPSLLNNPKGWERLRQVILEDADFEKWGNFGSLHDLVALEQTGRQFSAEVEADEDGKLFLIVFIENCAQARLPLKELVRETAGA